MVGTLTLSLFSFSLLFLFSLTSLSLLFLFPISLLSLLFLFSISLFYLFSFSSVSNFSLFLCFFSLSSLSFSCLCLGSNRSRSLFISCSQFRIGVPVHAKVVFFPCKGTKGNYLSLVEIRHVGYVAVT